MITASDLESRDATREQRVARQPLSEAVKHRAYLRDVDEHARTILTDLRAGGRSFIGYDCRQSPIDGGYYFNDVGDATLQLALSEGLCVRWLGCDDIGMSAELVGSRDARFIR